jgi:hypothetical protein
MSLIETIVELNTSPRGQEEEYQYTSDFVEWFYQYVYRGQGFHIHPILEKITHHPEYECIRELCRNLINVNYGKNLDNEKIVTLNDNLKKWTLDTIQFCT